MCYINNIVLYCKPCLSQNEHAAFAGILARRRCGFAGPQRWWQRALSVRQSVSQWRLSGLIRLCKCKYSLKTTVNTGAQWDCSCAVFHKGKSCQTCWMDSRTNCLVCSLGNNVGNMTSRLNHVNRNKHSESQQLYGKTQCLRLIH